MSAATLRKSSHDENVFNTKSPESQRPVLTPSQASFSCPSNDTPVKSTDESKTNEIVESSTPTHKKRRITLSTTDENVLESEANESEEKTEEEEAIEQEQVQQEQECDDDDDERMESVFACIAEAGYPSVYEFLEDLFTCEKPSIKAQVDAMSINHGHEILDAIRAVALEMVNEWMVSRTVELLRALH